MTDTITGHLWVQSRPEIPLERIGSHHYRCRYCGMHAYGLGYTTLPFDELDLWFRETHPDCKLLPPDEALIKYYVIKCY